MASSFLKNFWMVVRVGLARARFLAVFVAAALVVGYWDEIKNYVDKWTRPAVAPEMVRAGEQEVEYYCAMHPNIPPRSAPGDCPICGMPLVKRKKGEKVVLPAEVMARVQLTPQRMALAGVQTSVVESRKLVREIRAVGVLDYDETKVAKLAARVAGRADELFVKETGQGIKRGDPVYLLYSPEVYTAQREYLAARKRVNGLMKEAGEEMRQDAVEVYNASMQKLALWGTTAEQLDKLDREYDETGKVPSHFVVTSPISGVVVRKGIYEGAYVGVGETPLTIADLGTLWLQAQIFERDVPVVKVGERVEVRVEGRPEKVYEGRVTFLGQQLDPATRTLAARVVVGNAGGELKPGMFAEARIVVPVKAVEVASSAPATRAGMERTEAFGEALVPYFEVQKLLAADQTEGVVGKLHEMLGKVQGIQGDAAWEEAKGRLKTAVHGTMGVKDVEGLREGFRQVSAEMIALGKTAGTPAEGAMVRVFRCPMGKQPNWLQVGAETVNPFMGTKMVTCGAQIDTLPRVSGGPKTRPAEDGGKVVAVPRSAVIETGRGQVVFVANGQMEGVFDMRGVRLGELAGDWYPVLSGVEEGERVVTVGAFALDAENRLNPTVR